MPPQPLIPATIADVVVAGLDQLLPGARNLRLVGFSFGGHVAGLTAARLGEQIDTLTLVGVAALGLTAEPREPFAKQRPGMSAEEVAAVFQQNLRVLMFANPDNIDSLAIHLQAENIKRARFRSRPFATTDGLARALGNVTAAVHTIWGTQDIIARGSLDTRLEILRRHHRELKVRLIENAGHWVAYEAADRFNEDPAGAVGGPRARRVLLTRRRGSRRRSPGEGLRAARPSGVSGPSGFLLVPFSPPLAPLWSWRGNCGNHGRRQSGRGNALEAACHGSSR